MEDRVEACLGDRPTANSGEELGGLDDRDGAAARLLSMQGLVQFADGVIDRAGLMG